MNYNKLLVITGAFVFISTLHADWKIIPGSEFQKELRVWDAAPELKLDVYWQGERNSRNEAEGEGELIWMDEKGNVSIYSGKMVGGKREGFGTWLHRSGSKYIGQWKDNLKHGEGEYWLKDGAYLSGSFQLDNPHGEGKYVSSDGVIYNGGFYEGKKHGNGTMTFPDGRVHNSNWENDVDSSPPPPACEPYLTLGIDTKKYSFDGDIYNPEGDNCPGNTLTYRGRWNNGIYTISPHWSFYEDWVRGKMHPDVSFRTGDVSLDIFSETQKNKIRRSNPNVGAFPVFIELRVFNPSKNKITISSAEIECEQSQPDNQPILSIGDTNATYGSMAALISSFDNKPIEAIEIKYNILPLSEKSKPDDYRFQTTIAGFTDYTEWNFEKHLNEVFGDISLLKEILSRDRAMIDSAPQLQSLVKNPGNFAPFLDESSEFRLSAKIVGMMQTNWSDADGKKCSHNVQFEFIKCFFAPPLEIGGPGPVSGNYDVILENNSKNYIRPFSYKRSINPGGNDRFGIQLVSKESSFHRFRVRLNTTDGMEIISPYCEMHFLVPGGHDWDQKVKNDNEF